MSGVNKKNVGQPCYFFLLFVAGDEPNSTLAQTNLSLICNKHLAGRFNIEIVDVIEDFSTAIDYGVIVTPTLILMKPEPRVTIFGNLNDAKKVLAALRLKEETL
ncbi:MAG: circadian clock KaiB family protein [bacterium]